MAARSGGREGRQRLTALARGGLLALLAASLGALAYALLDAARDGDDAPEPMPAAPTVIATITATPSPATAPAGTPTATPSPMTTYLGEPPPELADADLAPAGETGGDLAFLDGVARVRVVRRYYVPVAAMGAGVDALTGARLAALARGEVADWAELGGVPGPVRAFTLRPDAEGAAPASFAPTDPDRVFADWGGLLDALTLDSGAWAFIPIEEVTPAVTAIAVDGVDLVRGRGDPDGWPWVEAATVAAFTERGRAAAEALAAARAAPLPDPITVIATGDILQSRCSLTAIRATGDWGAALRGPVGDYLASADLTLGSVDGSIQDIAEPLGCFPHVNLSSPPQVIEALTLSGFDGVTVATNHVFDCGAEPCGARALLRTIELLREAGIAVVGGGANLEEALAPAILTARGVAFGVLGFDDVAAYALEAGADRPGTAPLDDDYAEENAAGEPAFFRPAAELGLERFRARIAALAEEADVVIVQVQTGTEDTHDPSPRSVKALRAAVDAGATLAVGNQAHHVQAVEPAANAFIAYALGNFIYDQTRLRGHTQGYLLEAAFWGARLANLRFVPYVIEDLYRPAFAEGAVRAQILSDVFEASRRLAAGSE